MLLLASDDIVEGLQGMFLESEACFQLHEAIFHMRRDFIGLPGDTVEIKQGIVHVNGNVLPEPCVRPKNNVRAMQSDLRFIVLAESFLCSDTTATVATTVDTGVCTE